MNHPYRKASEEQRSQGKYSCSCCKRPWDVCIPSASYGVGVQGQCPACQEHGVSSMLASKVHVELWQAVVRDEKDRHDAESTALRKQLSELQQELDERPEKIVVRHVDLTELQDARDEAERAFRSRENAWQALCEVRLLHHEREPGRCRCGSRIDRCEVAKIVDNYPGLAKWEKDQVQRLRTGQAHKLPPGHPAVLDPRWDP